jgi:phosphoribosyl 1,2-cyclic phosphodiesterase
VRLKVWGARGSVAAPGAETMRYGGNTSCVQLTLRDGSLLVLDAGTGLRELGVALAHRRRPPAIHILLTHLHLDHIQGLMFFAPCFWPGARITVWGPPDPDDPLQDRLGRYISAPLAPMEIGDLPADISFRPCPPEWTIGGTIVHSAAVTHRGQTLGFRVEDGDQSLCYIPDHEPALGSGLADLDPEWISGYELARRASLLIHDCQYSDDEYPAHIGWGHSAMSDALTFAARAEAGRVLLFHHDPLHDDDTLDALGARARHRWRALGGRPGALSLAREGDELHLSARVGDPRPTSTAAPRHDEPSIPAASATF